MEISVLFVTAILINIPGIFHHQILQMDTLKAHDFLWTYIQKIIGVQVPPGEKKKSEVLQMK